MSKLLALILLIVGLVVALMLLNQKTGFFSRASISTAPLETRISNISDNSFTLSWVTQKPAIGYVTYGDKEESLDNTAADERDMGAPKPRTTHHVTLKYLLPGTTYYYKITSGGESYDNQGKPFTQSTAPTTAETPSLPEVLFGNVVKADQTPSLEGLVYASVGESTVISTTVGDDGSFLLTLNNARSQDLVSYVTVGDTDTITVSVQGGSEGQVSQEVQAAERINSQELVLQETAGTDSGLVDDLNGDGAVNAFDFALKIKDLLGN